jgi:uncharacterized protein YdeI (YjbR/CyaY-like superfamily)
VQSARRIRFTGIQEISKLEKTQPYILDAIEALTPGRQRGYLYYLSQAKQPKAREARVEKCVPRILEGLGFDD